MHVAGQDLQAQTAPVRYQPRGERRVIQCYDPQGFQTPTNPGVRRLAKMPEHSGTNALMENPEAWKKAIQTMVSAHGRAGVDTIVSCVFSRFSTNLPPAVTKLAEPIFNEVGWTQPLRAMQDAGYDYMQIAIDQAHKDGLTFLAGLRMNDRHGGAVHGKVYKEHPGWHLGGLPGGFDYARGGVRDRMLSFVRDVLDHYDLDGIEYDYMRFIHVFSVGTGPQNAPLLTQFHRRTRQLLDEAGRKRGRKLLLGVRVPHVLSHCHDVGFDVEAWIKEGLVDFVVPAHFGHTDFNTRVEDFRELTEGTDCRVYPSTGGYNWTGPSRLKSYRPEHFHAAAHNWYGFGADGIEIYNYQYISWELRLQKLRDLAPMRDPRTLAEYDRHYPFWRLLARQDIHYESVNEGTMTYDVIQLDRAGQDPRGTFDFRLAEDLADPKLSAMMEFKAVGMTEDDAIVVALNGKTVPDDLVERVYIWDGTNHEGDLIRQGDVYLEHHHGKPEPYYLCRLPLSSPPMLFGDNQLAVSLRGPAGAERVITIEEVDIKVHVK